MEMNAEPISNASGNVKEYVDVVLDGWGGIGKPPYPVTVGGEKGHVGFETVHGEQARLLEHSNAVRQGKSIQNLVIDPKTPKIPEIVTFKLLSKNSVVMMVPSSVVVVDLHGLSPNLDSPQW